MGRQGCAPHLGPNSFIFMQFSENILSNTFFTPNPGVLAPSSLVWEILDTPLYTLYHSGARTFFVFASTPSSVSCFPARVDA